MAPKGKAITVEMTVKKETKGTYVFEADDDDAAVPTLYVRKTAFKTAPKGGTLTFEAK